MVSNCTPSASAIDPSFGPAQQSLPLSFNEQSGMADESGSASTTPVSDTTETTTSDAESGESNQIHSERQVSAMDESNPT